MDPEQLKIQQTDSEKKPRNKIKKIQSADKNEKIDLQKMLEQVDQDE